MILNRRISGFSWLPKLTSSTDSATLVFIFSHVLRIQLSPSQSGLHTHTLETQFHPVTTAAFLSPFSENLLTYWTSFSSIPNNNIIIIINQSTSSCWVKGYLTLQISDPPTRNFTQLKHSFLNWAHNWIMTRQTSC